MSDTETEVEPVEDIEQIDDVPEVDKKTTSKRKPSRFGFVPHYEKKQFEVKFIQSARKQFYSLNKLEISQDMIDWLAIRSLVDSVLRDVLAGFTGSDFDAEKLVLKKLESLANGVQFWKKPAQSDAEKVAKHASKLSQDDLAETIAKLQAMQASTA